MPILSGTTHPQRSKYSSLKVSDNKKSGQLSHHSPSLGYPFQVGPRDPSLPEFYIDIKGFFANGTPIATVIPASTVNVTAVGQKVTGTWGNVGNFVGSSDLTTWTATFTAPEFGVSGTMKLTSNGKNHFGCNTTTDPYFTSVVPAGAALSPAEQLLFTQVGWATTIPGNPTRIIYFQR